MPRVGEKLNMAKNLIRNGHFQRKAKGEKYGTLLTKLPPEGKEERLF
jgi:hypothetical protein